MKPSQTVFRVRPAQVRDVDVLARHRSAMFRDMGQLAEDKQHGLTAATAAYLRRAIPSGEYLAWVAEDTAAPAQIVGGAGVQLRSIVPRPGGGGRLELGPEALVLNVYVERSWRRRGVAAALMHTLLAALSERDIRRVVLHASADGRHLYEQLGFAPTNEMRLKTT